MQNGSSSKNGFACKIEVFESLHFVSKQEMLFVSLFCKYICLFLLVFVAFREQVCEKKLKFSPKECKYPSCFHLPYPIHLQNSSKLHISQICKRTSKTRLHITQGKNNVFSCVNASQNPDSGKAHDFKIQNSHPYSPNLYSYPLQARRPYFAHM